MAHAVDHPALLHQRLSITACTLNLSLRIDPIPNSRIWRRIITGRSQKPLANAQISGNQSGIVTTMHEKGRTADPKDPASQKDEAPIQKLPAKRKRSHPRSFGAPSVAEFYDAIAKAAARSNKT
jgi:hypothetical protein